MLFVSRTTSQLQTQNLMAVKAEENGFIPTVLSEKSSWTESFAKTPSTVCDSKTNSPSTVDEKSFFRRRKVPFRSTRTPSTVDDSKTNAPSTVDEKSFFRRRKVPLPLTTKQSTVGEPFICKNSIHRRRFRDEHSIHRRRKIILPSTEGPFAVDDKAIHRWRAIHPQKLHPPSTIPQRTFHPPSTRNHSSFDKRSLCGRRQSNPPLASHPSAGHECLAPKLGAALG